MTDLRQLMDHHELGLRLEHGDPATEFASVRHADRDADRPWLDAGDLRLTEAGFDLPRPPVDPLFEPAPRALAFALTPRRRALPEALLRRALSAGVALLTVPPTVNLGRVEDAALVALANGAPEGVRASATAQRFLLRALESPKPERELLDRLQRLAGGSYVLLAPWGAVLARSGRHGWRAAGERTARLPEGRMHLGGADARVLRVNAGGRLRSMLIALEPDEAALPWLEVGRSLLAVAALGRSAEAGGDRARRAALLAEWLAGPRAARSLAPRLREAGLEPDASFTVAVAEIGPPLPRGRGSRAPDRLELPRGAGEELFVSLGVGVLSEARPDHVVWVFGGNAPQAHARALFDALETASPGGDAVRLGVSLPQHDPSTVADAYRQALLALQAMARPSGVATFDSFDPVAWVMAHQPEENLRALRDRLLGAITANDPKGKLRRTLQAYLRAPNDMGGLAAELHIHVNTLRYRLRRIESLLQQPLTRPETIARLYLAEQVDAMLDGDR